MIYQSVYQYSAMYNDEFKRIQWTYISREQRKSDKQHGNDGTVIGYLYWLVVDQCQGPKVVSIFSLNIQIKDM